MAKAVLFGAFAIAWLAVATYALAKYALPAWLRFKRAIFEQQRSLKERQLERDEALVEAAERDRNTGTDDG